MKQLGSFVIRTVGANKEKEGSQISAARECYDHGNDSIEQNAIPSASTAIITMR